MRRQKSNSFYKFNFKKGSPDEILYGKGQKIDSLEEIKNQSKKPILTPEIIGVYQIRPEDQKDVPQDIVNLIGGFHPAYNEEINSSQESLYSQKIIKEKYRTKEKINPSLISVIYDQENIPEKEIFEMYLEKDITKRILRTTYEQVPEFKNKNIAKAIPKDPEKMKDTEELKKIHESLSKIQNKYGLSQIEKSLMISIEEYKKFR